MTIKLHCVRQHMQNKSVDPCMNRKHSLASSHFKRTWTCQADAEHSRLKSPKSLFHHMSEPSACVFRELYIMSGLEIAKGFRLFFVCAC